MTPELNSHHIILWPEAQEFYVGRTYWISDAGLDVVLGQNLWFDLHAGDMLKILSPSRAGTIDVLAIRSDGEEHSWVIAYPDLVFLDTNVAWYA